MAAASSTSSGVAFVPSAVIEKALVHDMVYAGCPRCFTSVGTASSTSDDAAVVHCRSCGASIRVSELQYKYRLKLQVAYDDALVDAMLFDEAARALLGVQATAFKRALLPRHPMLPFVLADLLEGLHVAFHFQRRRQPSSSNPSSKPQYTKDLKIVRIAPLVRELLPKPAVPLALDVLLHGQQREASMADDRPSSDEISDLSTQ